MKDSLARVCERDYERRGGFHSIGRCFPYGGVNASSTNTQSAVVGVDVELRPLLVDAKGAARLLGIGRTTLYELMKTDAITPVRIGRCVRFPVAELERFVAGGCTVEPDASPLPKHGKGTTHDRPARREVLREASPRLFDPAS